MGPRLLFSCLNEYFNDCRSTPDYSNKNRTASEELFASPLIY